MICLPSEPSTCSPVNLFLLKYVQLVANPMACSIALYVYILKIGFAEESQMHKPAE
jgi:hypothetical protein